MCGRYSFQLSESEVSDLTGSAPSPFPEATYNQSPGVPIVVLDSDRQWDPMPWGAEIRIGPARKRLVINARSETAAGKRVFREAFARRRCVLPASGFFEWRRDGGRGQPFYFHPRTGPGILLGGMVLEEKDTAERRVVVLTRAADRWMEEIHHRAPILVRPDRIERWFDSALDGEAGVRAAAYPDEAGVLDRYPVSERVNRVAENDPGILTRVEWSPPPTQEELF